MAQPALKIPHPGHRPDRAPRPLATVTVLSPSRPHDGTTIFRCGGCGVTTRFAHADQQYGQLVHTFLDQHGNCGDAVEISPARPPGQRTRPGHDSTLWG